MGVMPRTQKFRVAAIFYSGMYEYDATHVYTMLDDGAELLRDADKISAIDVKVDDAEQRRPARRPRSTSAVGAARSCACATGAR